MEHNADESDIELCNKKLLPKNGSNAITKWSGQFGQYHPHRPILMRTPLYDDYTAPPDSPCKRRLSNSSGSSDQLCNGESSKLIQLRNGEQQAQIWNVEASKENQPWNGETKQQTQLWNGESKKVTGVCNGKSKKPSNRVDLLIAAANYYYNIEENYSMNCSTFSGEYENESANLIMLAEVAVQRIELERGPQTVT